MARITKNLKDPGSAITHFIGMMMAIFAATPLMIKSIHSPEKAHTISLAIFIVSMILMIAMLILCPILTYIIMMVSKTTIFSYIISCVMCGILSSLPVIIGVRFSRTMKKISKIIISIVFPIIFALILFITINL